MYANVYIVVQPGGRRRAGELGSERIYVDGDVYVAWDAVTLRFQLDEHIPHAVEHQVVTAEMLGMLSIPIQRSSNMRASTVALS